MIHLLTSATIASAAALVLPLCGCGTIGPLVDTSQPTRQWATVQVVWSTPAKIRQKCGAQRSSGLSNQACLINGYQIVARPCAGFNDETCMITLGHELYHALGGGHK